MGGASPAAFLTVSRFSPLSAPRPLRPTASPAEPPPAEPSQPGDLPGRDVGQSPCLGQPCSSSMAVCWHLCHAQEGHDQPRAPGLLSVRLGTTLRVPNLLMLCQPAPASLVHVSPWLPGLSAPHPPSLWFSSACAVISCPRRPLARRGAARSAAHSAIVTFSPRCRPAGDRGAEAAAGGAEAESGR